MKHDLRRHLHQPVIAVVIALGCALVGCGGGGGGGPAATGSISGVILDQTTSLPVAGATVSVGAVTTTTNANGQFTLTGVPVGSATIQITAGANSGTITVTVTQNQTTNAGTLVAGGGTISQPKTSVSGTVTDSQTGSALAQARVSMGGETTFTDTNGAYSFSNVQVFPRQTTVTVSLSASKLDYLSFFQEITVNQSGANTQDIALTPTTNSGLVAGTVVNASTGAGVIDADVEIGPSGSAQKGRTDKDGKFELSGVFTGQQEIRVTRTGFLGYTSTVDNIVQGQTTLLPANIQLTPESGTITVTGTVQDIDGNGIAGATVTVGGVSTTSGSDGSFTVTGAPTGTQTVSASAAGFQTTTFQTTISAQNNVIPIVLFSGTTTPPSTPFNVLGQATLSGQTDHTGITVRALEQPSDTERDIATTEADGTFRLFVPPGEYRIEAAMTGFQTATTMITVPATGKVVTGIDLQLSP